MGKSPLVFYPKDFVTGLAPICDINRMQGCVMSSRLRIPEHPATCSDHIRPPVPTHSVTSDALP